MEMGKIDQSILILLSEVYNSYTMPYTMVFEETFGFLNLKLTKRPPYNRLELQIGIIMRYII